MSPDPLLTDEDELASMERSLARRRAIGRALTLLVLLAVPLIVGAIYEFELRRAWRRLTLPAPTPTTMATAEAGLARVHADLLPDWMIAMSRAESGEPCAPCEEAFAALVDELKGQDALIASLQELKALTADKELLHENIEAIRENTRRWNLLMEQGKQPWWLDSNVMMTPNGPFFYTKSYRVLSDHRVPVGATQQRARFVTRVDHTNVVESMLGHASLDQDGAILLVDRLQDFAIQEVWPLLDTRPEADALRTPRELAFGPVVRDEIAAVLPADALALLRAAAPHRLALRVVINAVRARERCGSAYRIRELPWDGLHADEHDSVLARGRSSYGEDCPALTEAEAEQLVEASDALRAGGPALQQAVAQLVAAVARGTFVHELRHGGDHHAVGDMQTPLPCSLCDEARMSKSTRAELSAYLASFAAAQVAATSLYQACSLDLTRMSPHTRALQYILIETSHFSCEKPPPANLREMAAEQEQRYFGRSDKIAIPADYPPTL